MSISAVIFDLDGTLLYTLEDLTDSTNSALRKFGFQERSLEEVKNFVGNGISMLIQRVVPDGLNNPNFKKCLEFFKEHYTDNMYNKTKPYEGIIPLLEELKRNNYKIAVISNKFDDAVKSLCEKYFSGYIDIAVGQKDDIDKKPAPGSVFKIIKELNLSKDECVFVGDSEVDIQTAHNAEIPCISVTWGYKSIDFLYDNGAECIIYTPEELLELI